MQKDKPSGTDDAFPIGRALSAVRKMTGRWKTPAVTVFANQRRSAFMILVSTVLSLRTKDETTGVASRRLFKRARTPRGMLRLSVEEIVELIYPVGFYNVKAKNLLQISEILIERHGGKTPKDMEALLSLPGVGRKTANLVLTLGHGLPGICVDIHVHRITNRWGYVRTKNPDQTEFALREILPKRYWIPINDWLVSYGQNLCAPTSPKCSECPIERHCAKVGVTRSR